jgi:hypothetical protein
MWSSNRNDRTILLVIGITILGTMFAQEFLVPGSTHKVVNEIQWIAKPKK